MRTQSPGPGPEPSESRRPMLTLRRTPATSTRARRLAGSTTSSIWPGMARHTTPPLGPQMPAVSWHARLCPRSGRYTTGWGHGQRGMCAGLTPAVAVGPDLEHRQERLLRHLDPADLLHALLAFLLLLEQLALTCDVTAVALGDHVLAHRLDGLAGDDLRADRRLDRHLVLLARDLLAQALDQTAADRIGVVLVDDH